MLVGPLFRMGKNGTRFETKRLTDILASMIPIIFTGLSVCIMFSANQFNLGAEGGIMLGAFVTGMAAIYLPMAAGLHPIVAILLGGLAVGVMMLLPAFTEEQARRERDGVLADAQLHRHVPHQVRSQHLSCR